MGIDQPVWTQYWRYVKGFVTGDWGFAYSAGETVRQQIGALALTAVLAVCAVIGTYFATH